MVRQIANPDVGLRELEAVCSLDPLLAGRLIQIANSAYYSPRLPIGTIFHAVSFIGMETTRRVLLAAALRGTLRLPQSHRIWNHSLDVAQTAEMLALQCSSQVDPSQAFLAGLIHDIGRLAFSVMPAPFIERFHRLTDGGCPPVEVETCLSGRCHGEVGAETLAQWNFPVEIVDAVRWHHRPERSPLPLASLLYLAEFITDSQEDLPSYVRLNTACRQAGISMADLTELSHQDAGGLESLRFGLRRDDPRNQNPRAARLLAIEHPGTGRDGSWASGCTTPAQRRVAAHRPRAIREAPGGCSQCPVTGWSVEFRARLCEVR